MYSVISVKIDSLPANIKTGIDPFVANQSVIFYSWADHPGDKHTHTVFFFLSFYLSLVHSLVHSITPKQSRKGFVWEGEDRDEYDLDLIYRGVE